MGIHNLAKLIKEKCPNSIKNRTIYYYSSSKIGIDASMALYQFLIAVRSGSTSLTPNGNEGSSSHLVGLFYRSIRMIEAGIIPLFVFDGKAPEMKMHELSKRSLRRENATEKLKIAIDCQDFEGIAKNTKLKVKIEAVHVEEAQKLLSLIGCPYVVAESEAEAYCSYLCKHHCIEGVATEDMDTLCFGANKLIRNLNCSASKKLDIHEYSLSSVLKDLDLNMDSFIDLCILLGCDYCGTLKGVGFKRAFDYIKKYGNIESILENEKIFSKIKAKSKEEDVKKKEGENSKNKVKNKDEGDINKNSAEEDKEKEKDIKKDIKKNKEKNKEKNIKKEDEISNNSEEEDSNNCEENAYLVNINKARNIFKTIGSIGELVTSDEIKIKYDNINIEKIKEFLCTEKGFDPLRVEKGVDRILNTRNRCKQMKIDNFFKKK